MIDGRSEEEIDKLLAVLDQRVMEVESAFRTSKVKLVEQKTADGKDKPGFVPLKPFQAPPGWKPPGWSDESAYQNSVAGMRGVTNVGGGKIGGSVKKK